MDQYSVYAIIYNIFFNSENSYNILFPINNVPIYLDFVLNYYFKIIKF